MNPIVLFRADSENHKEYPVLSKYFEATKLRNAVPENRTVIGRYSCLPYYKELEEDLALKNSKLINSYKQHRWIANFDYYDIVAPYTFETWFDSEHLPDDGTQFVVKGRTNSRKAYWKDKMFAENKRTAILTAISLREDPLINEQGIIYRRYTPLVTYEVGLNGLPFTNEWRFFFYKKQVLSYGYYWTMADDLPKDIHPDGIEFAKKVAELVADHVNFFVLDVAEKKEGGWVLVEINDGQMSGLSENDPETLYANLKKEIDADGQNA
jgi:hypothetical protein